MNADTCKDILKALEICHDRKLPQGMKDAFWSEFRDYRDQAMMDTLQATYRKFPVGRMPWVEDFRAILADMRNAKIEREKKTEMENRSPLSRPKPSRFPMVGESFRILSGLFYSGDEGQRLTGRQCAEEMIGMEEKYPGIGWRQGAEQLAAWLDRKEKREAEEVDKELRELEARARANLEKGAE